MRRHGCHPPFEPLQLLSWALLLLLGAAFYALILPLCPASAKAATAAAYGAAMALTFGLALATTCIDPADPKVKAQLKANKGSEARAAAAAASIESEGQEDDDEAQHARGMDGIGQRRGVLMSMDAAPGVYCFLCRVDVAESSAHCRHCRKCCDRWDHHCAWLNTCIGRPNYAPFLGTVTAALALLGLQTAAAALLLARFGLRRGAFVEQGTVAVKCVGCIARIHCYTANRVHSLPPKPNQPATAALPLLPPNACAGLLALLLAATTPLLLLVAHLLLFHCMLLSQGLTAYEFVLRETQRRTAKAEAAAARWRQRQQILTAASAAVEKMGGGGGKKAPPPPPPTTTVVGQQQPSPQRGVVFMSPPPSRSSCVDTGGGGARSWWPWRGHRQQRRSEGLPGDEFLVVAPNDDGEQGAGSAAAAASCPAV